jgi:hypothetical protein
MVLSPKTKAEHRIKTEGRDLDFNQLCELMYSVIHQENRLSEGRSSAKPKESTFRQRHSNVK